MIVIVDCVVCDFQTKPAPSRRRTIFQQQVIIASEKRLNETPFSSIDECSSSSSYGGWHLVHTVADIENHRLQQQRFSSSSSLFASCLDEHDEIANGPLNSIVSSSDDISYFSARSSVMISAADDANVDEKGPTANTDLDENCSRLLTALHRTQSAAELVVDTCLDMDAIETDPLQPALDDNDPLEEQRETAIIDQEAAATASATEDRSLRLTPQSPITYSRSIRLIIPI